MKIRSTTLLLILSISLPGVTLAEPQSKSWTQKAKEIITNKKVIAGVTIGLAAVIGVTGIMFGYRSWSKQKEAQELAKWELEIRGYNRPPMPAKQYQEFVNLLIPDLESLHVGQEYIKNLHGGLNQKIARALGPNAGGTILVGVLEAQPLESDDPITYQSKKLEVVKKLIQAGSYPNANLASGFGSILEIAISTKQNEIAKYLIDHDAIKFENLRRKDDCSILWRTIQSENWEMVPYLLQHELRVIDWQRVFVRAFSAKGLNREEVISELRKIPEIPQDQLEEYLSMQGK